MMATLVVDDRPLRKIVSKTGEGVIVVCHLESRSTARLYSVLNTLNYEQFEQINRHVSEIH